MHLAHRHWGKKKKRKKSSSFNVRKRRQLNPADRKGVWLNNQEFNVNRAEGVLGEPAFALSDFIVNCAVLKIIFAPFF